MIIVTQDAERKHCCGDCSNRREYEQIWPIDPTMQNWKIFGQRVGEDNHKEPQYADREHADLAARDVANLALAFSDQPAGAEKRIAKAQADAAKDRKRGEPADLTAGIFAVREPHSFYQGTDRQPLYKSRDQGPTGKAQIPDPAQPLRLVAKLERHAAQDQAQQHD